MTTATAPTAELTSAPTISIDRIVVLGDNHRSLDNDWVESLADSMRLVGVTDPLDVRPYGDGMVALVAGEHRLAAAKLAGLDEVPYNLHDGDRHSARAAIENVAHKKLNPLEEARAAGGMVADGFSHHDTAQALGWRRRKGEGTVPDTALVKARLTILDLPEAAQQLVAVGSLPLRVVPVVVDVHQRAPELCADIVAALAAGDVRPTDLLEGAGYYGSPLEKVVRNYSGRAYAAVFKGVSADDLSSLRLGKKATETWQAADELHEALYKTPAYYARTPFAVGFASIELEQARVVGALLEFGADDDRPVRVILDRGLHRDLARQAIARRLEELRAEERQRDEERAERKRLNLTPIDATVSKHRATLRDLTRQAHGTNLDLWKKLQEDLAVVAPDDMNVARFYVYSLLGSFNCRGVDIIRQLAATGIRLVVEQLRTETTPRRADGTKGVPKVEYSTVTDATDYLRKYVDGARTAGELFGRGLVVFAAQHYATQIVLSRSGRGHRMVEDLDGRAQKAFLTLTKGAEPASLRQLKRAIATALANFESAAAAQRRARAKATAEAEAAKEAAAENAAAAEDDAVDDSEDDESENQAADDTLAELEAEEADLIAA